MVAYYGHWDRAPELIEADGWRTKSANPELLLDERTEARVSRNGGASWSAPVVVAPDLTNSMTPFVTASGRVILPGNLTFPYTDDPMGLDNWRWSGVPGLHEGVTDSYFNRKEINKLANTGESFNEACCYQLDDGTLRMMLRNEKKRKPEHHTLGVSESRDDGLTWSSPILRTTPNRSRGPISAACWTGVSSE